MLAMVLLALALLAPEAAAQQAAPTATRSTLTGVYSASQASRGRDVYAGTCQGCHSAASHAGTVFWSRWAGRPLWALFGYVQETMPKYDPGSLTPDEYAQVVAYLLELNRMPAGQDELPADSAALKTIRIDTTVAQQARKPHR